MSRNSDNGRCVWFQWKPCRQDRDRQFIDALRELRLEIAGVAGRKRTREESPYTRGGQPRTRSFDAPDHPEAHTTAALPNLPALPALPAPLT